MTRRELVGHVAVDSGQVMVGDPCYLDTFTAGDFVPTDATPSGAYSYQGACEATCSPTMHGELGNESACVTSTGYGDGSYPVYAERNRDGRIIRLTVEFVVESDEDEL